MKSSYKLLGPYIREIDNRNASGKEENLLGVSTNKVFIQSVANTVGTDFCGYKVVTRNQFTYVPDTSRRGDRIGIALLENYDEAIVSSAYTVFEIIDHTRLLPQYLMMWFRRPEFDRYARFISHGSVREIFGWEEMCNVELPVPSLEKQKEIVKEYHTIVNRIKLNEQLNKKLEETAQAIYKQWFVDFEFPDEEGKPYKSSGGEMACTSNPDQEIPAGWKQICIQDLIDSRIIDNNQDGNHGELHPKTSDYVPMGVPFIMAKDIVDGVLDLQNCSFISKEQANSLRVGFANTDDVLLTHKGTMGRVAIVPSIQDFIVLTPQITYFRIIDQLQLNKEFLYCLFNSRQFQNILQSESDQSTRKFIGITEQRLITIVFPTKKPMQEFGRIICPILQYRCELSTEIAYLRSLADCLTAKVSKGVSK